MTDIDFGALAWAILVASVASVSLYIFLSMVEEDG